MYKVKAHIMSQWSIVTTPCMHDQNASELQRFKNLSLSEIGLFHAKKVSDGPRDLANLLQYMQLQLLVPFFVTNNFVVR